MYNLKVAIFDENMAIGKSKYLVILYLYELTQLSDPLILGGLLILLEGAPKLISREQFKTQTSKIFKILRQFRHSTTCPNDMIQA